MAQEYDKYGDSSYSQYPTDDNKYECRTGPFEGFFVSSVEFCKHVKFDDRKDHRDRDNKTGTQGPPGPQGPRSTRSTRYHKVHRMMEHKVHQGINGSQGPPGINGAQGPPGPSTINTTNVYTNVGPTRASIFTNGFGSSVALCDPGDTALSGSFVTNTPAVIKFSKPLANETGWNATAQTQFSGTEWYVTADVECFDNPPLH